MGSNVFGNAITNKTLMDLPEYKDKTIGPRERATEALHMRSAEGKDLKARNYVESLRKDWEKYVETAKKDFNPADKTCVLVLLYNATGDTLKLVADYDWAGHIGRAPHPLRIENGQWGAFLHVSSLAGVEDEKTEAGYHGSVGRATYRGKNEAGEEIDFYFWWSNMGPNSIFYQEHMAYVESPSTFSLSEESIKIPIPVDPQSPKKPKVKENSIQNMSKGIVWEATMGHGISPIYELLVTLENAG